VVYSVVNDININKKSETTIFKALQRETSVFKYYIELKEDVLTQEGFLDLVRVPRLYVDRVGQFLKDLRKKYQLSLEKIGKIVKVTRSQVAYWEKNQCRILLQSLIKIANRFNISKETIYSMIDRGELSLRTNLPVKLEKIQEFVPYFSLQKPDCQSKINLLQCSTQILQSIKDTLNLNFHFRSTKGIENHQATINSRELYNYLKTFFRYVKTAKIQLPLTSDVKFWHENGIDLKRAIICPCLQSDGTVLVGKKVVFKGLNKSLHDYFVDSMYFEYGIMPSSYFWYNLKDNMYFTEYTRKAAIRTIDEIMKLAGNCKTSPARNQTVEEYLKEPHPHLNYLINAPVDEQKIALRIWASAEGCIALSRRNSYIYPELQIACTHPRLITQLKKLAKNHGIQFTKMHSKRYWSRIQGLKNSSISGSIAFLKLGGFIKGVKISSNSPYHEGIDKDILLLGILEFMKRRKTNVSYKEIVLEDVHHKINKIIESGEYESDGKYYIEYFSKRNDIQ